MHGDDYSHWFLAVDAFPNSALRCVGTEDPVSPPGLQQDKCLADAHPRLFSLVLAPRIDLPCLEVVFLLVDADAIWGGASGGDRDSREHPLRKHVSYKLARKKKQERKKRRVKKKRR